MKPKRTSQQRQGSIGLNAFELFVNRELGWVFRPVHQECDFGIDGYLDVVDNGEVTGASLAVQIKCGKSYISKKTLGGIRYDGEIKHLNYYTNLRMPVLLIVFDEKGESGYWVVFQAEKSIPAQSADRWWIEIPQKNILQASVEAEWRTIAGPIIDVNDYIQDEWAHYEFNNIATNLIVGIEKKHVIACDTTSLFLWQQRLTKTRQMMFEKRGKVEFWFQGWQDDHRELYEIQEIKAYFAATIRDGFPWIYWLEADNLWVGYQLLFACTGSGKISKSKRGVFIERDSADIKEWMMEQFNNLNHFTETNNIPIAINKEISENLMRFLGNKTGANVDKR